MRERAAILGDDGTGRPDQWETQKGKPVWQDGVHILASLYTDEEGRLDEEAQWVVDGLGPGAELVGQQDAAQLRGGDGELTKREHFGFVDGLGTMDIESPGLDDTPGSGKLDPDRQWIGLAPGETLFGYRDEADEYPDAPTPPSFVLNGTFLVYRKLRENVSTFRTYLRSRGAEYGDTELLAAKIVGRFRDGTPLALSSVPCPAMVADPHRNNDFLYGDDPNGAKCPLGAHIRRSRPRDALGFEGKVTDRRRLQRRGMPFGPPLPEDAPDDGAERGILFMAFCIDIERQFEFVQQQWLNYGNTFGQGNDKDILTGNHAASPGALPTEKAVIQATAERAPFVCASLPRFVDMRGGDYFFVPGIAGLRAIAGT
jgi:Dyp-type peroxidase family